MESRAHYVLERDQARMTAGRPAREGHPQYQPDWVAAFQALPDGLALLAPDFTVQWANEALGCLVDLDPAEMIGRNIHELLHGDAIPPEWSPAHPLAGARNAFGTEIHLPRSGLILSLHIAPLYDATHQWTGFVYCVRDVTVQARLREQLLQSEKMVAIGQLVAGVAHELNNPLTVIIGFAELLGRQVGSATPSQQEVSPSYRSAIRRIQEGAERARKIVGGLLTFARQQEPSRERCDLNEIVQATLELRAYELRVNKVRVVTELAPDLPALFVDRHQMQQVLFNLILNAEQAMVAARGRGTLTLRSWHEPPAARVCVEVADDGPGVPPDLANRIFDPFFTTKQVGEGTGLGLSIALGIVQEHGGRLTLSRAPRERGAAFFIELPVSGEAEVLWTVLPEVPAEVRSNRGRRVLIVDDEQSIVEMLQRTLGARHEVMVAHSGRQAYDAILRYDYDAILCDLKMPDLGGKELFQRLSLRAPDKARRMVFMTGDTVSEATYVFLEESGQPYIEKPFRASEVATTLERFLAGQT
jgi:two-component system NtrC family sensor kinase